MDMTIEHRRTASAWHDGYWSPLYAYASREEVGPGIDTEIRQILDLIEGGWLDSDTRDMVAEHARLTALMVHVTPHLAADTAERLGRAEGFAAAAYWIYDRLDGPWEEHLRTSATRTEAGLHSENSDILEDLPQPLSSTIQMGRIERECLGPRPDRDDVAAYAAWNQARPSIHDAHKNAFQTAVRETILARCQEILRDTAMLPPGLSQTNIDSARLLGASIAHHRPELFHLDPTQARSILDGTTQPEPTLPWPNLTHRMVDRHVQAAASSTTLAAMQNLLEQAWNEGHAAIWDDALRAAALTTLGNTDQAKALDRQVDDRLQKLRTTVGHEPEVSLPYLRPIPTDEIASTADLPSHPQRWAVKPVGDWNGTPHEAVYDPACHDISLTPARGEMDKATGWQLAATDGTHGLWIKDKQGAAVEYLAHKADQLRAQLDLQVDTPSPPPSRDL